MQQEPQRRAPARGRRHDDTPDTGDLFRRLADTPPGLRRQALRQQVILAWTPVAMRLARRYRGRGEPIEDLQQVAVIGLIKAVDRFDPDRGSAFLSFAVPTIDGEIKRHFRDHLWSVHVPRKVQELRSRLRAACLDLLGPGGAGAAGGEEGEAEGAATGTGVPSTSASTSASTGASSAGVASAGASTTSAASAGASATGVPTTAEIAARTGMTEAEIRLATGALDSFAALSLEAVLSAHDRSALLDHLGDRDPALDRVVEREALKPRLRDLPERERDILYLRFFEDLTQSQIADRLGISQMHVSRLLSRTFSRLRTAGAGDTEGAEQAGGAEGG